MEWTYQGKKYTTKPIETYYTPYPSHMQECKNWQEVINVCNNAGIVYHSRWDKCYKLIEVTWAGNGHRLKAWIEDVYTGKEYVCCLQDLEIVKLKEI